MVIEGSDVRVTSGSWATIGSRNRPYRGVRLNSVSSDARRVLMKLMSVMVAVVLAVVVTGCDLDGETDEAGNRSSASASATTPLDPVNTTSTGVDGTAQGSDRGEVFASADDPEVIFTGPLETSAGSLVIRYEPNSWYRESGIATLPSVGDLHWFLDTEEGCLVVDRSTFIDVAGPGHEITITPAPGGEISIGESIPLWIEGDWLIHDGCAKGDPIIRQGQ